MYISSHVHLYRVVNYDWSKFTRLESEKVKSKWEPNVDVCQVVAVGSQVYCFFLKRVRTGKLLSLSNEMKANRGAVL